MLIVLLVIMLGGLCYYRTRREHQQRQQEISAHSQDSTFHHLNEPSSELNTTEPSRSNFYTDVLQLWKYFRHGSITDRNTRTMSTEPPNSASVAVPSEPPPAYEGR